MIVARCRPVLALLLLLAACAQRPATVPANDPPTRQIHVTSNDWHTRIVVATADLPRGLLPETALLPATGWVAVGWGDHLYYPMRNPPRRLAVRAALLPGPAVLHLVPLPAPPRPFEGFEVLAIGVTEDGLGAMLAAIDATLDRQGGDTAPVAADGLYPGSLFFPATGRFHLLNTCNTWVAGMLVVAGLPIRAGGVVTAEDLMRQLRDLPTVRPAGG